MASRKCFQTGITTEIYIQSDLQHEEHFAENIDSTLYFVLVLC